MKDEKKGKMEKKNMEDAGDKDEENVRGERWGKTGFKHEQMDSYGVLKRGNFKKKGGNDTFV
jgi:hypothetical protein